MDLSQFLMILWRRKWVIITTIMVTEIVVITGTLIATPIYSVSTTLRIASAASGSIDYYDYMYADRLKNTYIKLATTTPLLDELKQRLKLSKVPPIEVKTIPETELFQISVEYHDPIQAADVANTMADILIGQTLELYTGSGKSSQEILSEQLSKMEEEVIQTRKEYLDLVTKSPEDTEGIETAKVKLDLEQEMYASLLERYEATRLKEALSAKSISVVEPAIPPDEPSKPRKVLNIALGFLISLVGGLGLAFLFENLDSTLYSTEQIEAVTGLSSIGKVPRLENQHSLISQNRDFASWEAFRSLRTNIIAMDESVQTLLISSAEPKEGKSMIVANLACVMAQSGKKVIVIDGDLRVPTLHKIFNIQNEMGLSNILESKANLTEAVHTSEVPGVFVLPSGPLPTNPAELLGSDIMTNLIQQLSQQYDLVLMDTPAILAVTDAAVLAPKVDAVALVVCRSETRQGAVRAAQAQISKVKANLIGVIINRAEENSHHYYYNLRQSSQRR